MLPRQLHHDSDNSSDNNVNDDAGGEMDADAEVELGSVSFERKLYISMTTI